MSKFFQTNQFHEKKSFIFFLAFLFSINSFSQKFQLGSRITPNTKQFKILDFSPSTGVYTYKYIGVIKDKYLFDHRIGEITIGLKKSIVVTTVYFLIPKKGENDISESTVKLIEKSLSIPLVPLPHNKFAVNVGDILISLDLGNNSFTFDKFRMIYLTTIKYSILMP